MLSYAKLVFQTDSEDKEKLVIVKIDENGIQFNNLYNAKIIDYDSLAIIRDLIKLFQKNFPGTE